jgi:hypothetical protein
MYVSCRACSAAARGVRAVRGGLGSLGQKVVLAEELSHGAHRTGESPAAKERKP